MRTGGRERASAARMSGTCSGGRPQQAVRGLTLLELLVTMALLSLVAVISLPYVTRSNGAARLDGDARALASRLRAAREEALSSRLQMSVVIDLAEPGLRGSGGQASYRFQSVDRIEVMTGKGIVTTPNAIIDFRPDGSSSGGVILLHAGAKKMRVTVQWLTGSVNTSEASP